MSEQRTNEIGIRKVNGAVFSNLIFLLNRDLIKWILLDFVIAFPLAFCLEFAFNNQERHTSLQGVFLI